MQLYKVYFLVTALLLSMEAGAASMFNDLQNQEKENAHMCKKFQKKLHKAQQSDNDADRKRINGYQKRVELYCPATSSSMFSEIQNGDAEKARMCKTFQKKRDKLKAKEPLDASGKKSLESYEKRVKLYCPK